jgi:hypothetical protein
MVLAASVAQDPTTLNWSVTGIYSRLGVVEFPALYASMEVYVALTNGHGDYLIELQLIDANEARPPIFRQLLSVRFQDPLELHELVYHQYAVTIPEAGNYRLRLYAHPAALARDGHGSFILERAVIVTQEAG